MQIDWELSQSIPSVDGQGIRCAAVIVKQDESTQKKDDAGTAEVVGATAADEEVEKMTVGNDNNDDNDMNVSLQDQYYSIVLGNQGGHLCEYSIPSGIVCQLIAFQHDHSITALLSSNDIPTNNDSNMKISRLNDFYVTGCKDSKIRIFNMKDHICLYTLIGHEKPVTSLSWIRHDKTGYIYLVSGSWDGTAKIWDIQHNFALITTLTGHENSVCVIGLPTASMSNNNPTNDGNVYIATGSAGIAQGSTIRNHTVRIWQVDLVSHSTPQIIHEVSNDHDGPIRDITITAPDHNNGDHLMLITCSNDGTIKLRDIRNGTCSNTLAFIPPTDTDGPPMFLSVRMIVDPDGQHCIVAAAEDGNVVIWNYSTSTNEYEQQVIRHSQTVWNIIPLPNGDFGTCSQDGIFRIFTKSTDRMASIDERNTFHESVQDTIQSQQNGPTSDEIAKLPQWENQSAIRGKSDGQVQLFQKNHIAIAAQWNMISQTWIEVGQVMGRGSAGDNTADDNSNNIIDGIRYDYVFPIEVDGAGGVVHTLQIGYNIGENQFNAAQRFIDSHELPQYHLSQIADYIQQRTGTAGGGRPVIGGSTATTMMSSGATTGTPIASFQYIPSKSYKIFDIPTKNIATTFEKMKSKMIEYQLLISDNEQSNIDTLMVKLIDTSHYHTSIITDQELNTIIQIFERAQQQPQHLFPILDLLRCIILHPSASTTDRINTIWNPKIMTQIVLLLQNYNSYSPPLLDNFTTAMNAIPMLSFRFIANYLKVLSSLPSTEHALIDLIHSIVPCIEMFISAKQKTIRQSIGTTIYNICHFIHVLAKKSTDDIKISFLLNDTGGIISKLVYIIDMALFQLKSLYEMESFHMILIGLGTICMINIKAKNIAQQMYFMSMKVEPAASIYQNDNVKITAKEVYAILS